MHNESIDKAVNTIQAGGLLAYPTEAVIGLGCDPFNQAAVQRLLDLKRRPADKGLILIANSWSQLEDLLLPLSSEQLTKMQASWPGPTTWLVPCKASVPRWLKGRFESLAVRIPGHGIAREICNAAGSPLVSTSANFSGEEAAVKTSQLPKPLVDALDFVFPADAGTAPAPSQIIDLLTGAVVRRS